jgi:hypothetical protein
MASAPNENDITPPAPLDKLRLLLCPPLPERNEDFDQTRQLIKLLILPCVPDYEEKIGLTASSSQFVEDLIEAILLCILVNQAPPERLSEGRKRLLSISKDAQSAADILQRLDAALQQTTFIYPGVLRRYLVLGKQTPELIALSKLARAHAEDTRQRRSAGHGRFSLADCILSAHLRMRDRTCRKGDVELL